MSRVRNLIVAAALSAGLFTGTSSVQAQGNAERKVLDRVPPVYPEIAKHNHIVGVVKLEVVVRANGSVRSTRVLGGSPVLIQSATDAARQWRFGLGPEETTEIVQLTYTP